MVFFYGGEAIFYSGPCGEIEGVKCISLSPLFPSLLLLCFLPFVLRRVLGFDFALFCGFLVLFFSVLTLFFSFSFSFLLFDSL